MPARSRPASSATRGALLSALLLLALTTAACGGPVELARPPAADRATCAALAERLPARLADLAAVEFTPKDAAGGAWGDPPITLTCGVGAPEGFGPASSCLAANGVDWFAPDEETKDEGSDVTLTTVTLRPRVALHVPARYRGATVAAALADLARPLTETLTVSTPCQ